MFSDSSPPTQPNKPLGKPSITDVLKVFRCILLNLTCIRIDFDCETKNKSLIEKSDLKMFVEIFL